jgi:hypothetical protein
MTSLTCAVQSYNYGKPISYDLAFVELLDSGDTHIQDLQMADLAAYLDAQAQSSMPLSVYVFVHGWRHNAALDNGDVARFHTILAMMKSNWIQANQPKRQVLGVYIGWRGQSIREPGWGKLIDTVAALPSFPDRKSQSDRNANRLHSILIDLEARLERRKANADDPSLVVIGHSLGGNMVLRATQSVLLDHLKDTAPGNRVRGFGSLVVLLNPASELTLWRTLQRASRKHSGIASPDRASFVLRNECKDLLVIDKSRPREKCDKDGTAWIYPKSQLPVLVSFSASEHFGEVADNYWLTDAITTRLGFSFSQYVFKWPREQSDLIALGHALPLRAYGADGRPNFNDPDNRLYGITHEMEVNKGSRSGSQYGDVLRNAENRTNFCDANQKLLSDSIELAVTKARHENPHANGRDWNQEKLWLDKKSKELQLNLKHGAARNKCSSTRKLHNQAACTKLSGSKQVPRLGDIYDPYWNIAVHPNLIESHGRYVSQNLWCFVHGLVATPPR